MSAASTMKPVAARDERVRRPDRARDPHTGRGTAQAGPPAATGPTAERLGPLGLVRIKGDPVDRRPASELVTGDAGAYLFVQVQGESRGVVEQDGRRAFLEPGDIALYDTARPCALTFPACYLASVLLVPLRSIRVSEADLRRIRAVTVPGDTGLGALLSSFFLRIAEEAGSYSAPVRERLGHHMLSMVSMLVAEQLRGEAVPVPDTGQDLMCRIQTFIDRNLGDPDLSPESVARAHRISVRYLHKLFERGDRTVGRWILQRRLEQCRNDLVSAGRTNHTVSAVAMRWGFVSPSHFSRAFRSFYGMSPMEWRSTAARRSEGGTGQQ